MEHPTCATCPFWREWQLSKGTGDCRRHEPTVLRSKDFSDGTTRVESHWPETEAEEWCGEHPRFRMWVKDDETERAVAAMQEAYKKQYPTVE
jgi:hypothetical protein